MDERIKEKTEECLNKFPTWHSRDITERFQVLMMAVATCPLEELPLHIHDRWFALDDMELTCGFQAVVLLRFKIGV